MIGVRDAAAGYRQIGELPSHGIGPHDLDLQTGDLLERHVLSEDLRRLSIRHLTVGANDIVAFGCQYRGDEDDLPPLMGFHWRGETLSVVPAPEETQLSLKNYIGSVTADRDGSVVAASAPCGGVVNYGIRKRNAFSGRAACATAADSHRHTGVRHFCSPAAKAGSCRVVRMG